MGALYCLAKLCPHNSVFSSGAKSWLLQKGAAGEMFLVEQDVPNACHISGDEMKGRDIPGLHVSYVMRVSVPFGRIIYKSRYIEELLVTGVNVTQKEFKKIYPLSIFHKFLDTEDFPLLSVDEEETVHLL